MAKTYVDGFVIPIPIANRAAYKKMAKEAAVVWRKHGALDYKECRADDMTPAMTVMTFPKMAKIKEGEEVWFSYIVFASKAERKRINKLVMKEMDELFKDKPMPMPFDMKRFAYGGFIVEVE